MATLITHSQAKADPRGYTSLGVGSLEPVEA